MNAGASKQTRFSLSQRSYICVEFFKLASLRRNKKQKCDIVREQFAQKFPLQKLPSRQTILRNVKKF
jgi:hypothetical protein